MIYKYIDGSRAIALHIPNNPSGIPERDPPSSEDPREPTIHT